MLGFFLLCFGTFGVCSLPVNNNDPELVSELRGRLQQSSALFARSKFLDVSPYPVKCSCQSYCTGQCFSPGCAPCPVSTWSFPGGRSLCLDPGPLGTGLLCTVHANNGSISSSACCSTGGVSCSLPPDSCCASGSCSSCPPYPPKAPLFPLLNETNTRAFDDQTNTCTGTKFAP
mmetsp:Transcript_29368/g.57632  ORF Transcript_29368/g.57632 Transcript_29368/m.57632 type:complete len:174 (-) Transcript_29368:325-846(-)